MTPTLEPPVRRESPAPHEPFPYADRDGRSLPRPGPSGVLQPNGDGPTGAPGELSCPACGDRTVNGAGLFACTACEWTGRLE
ncbi:hypothetical protein [Halovivax sp.]|uniref:hypothetical protein n=1 Tax=Halovivax sp. TaxID=1935978 RepID=UPI0025C2E871|nr:hypothetical protein [Halovivax sp.]